MLSTDVCEEDLPLVVEEGLEALLVGVADGGELDGVQAELLQVAHVQIPGHKRQHVVERHAGRIKEAMIVWTDTDFHTVSKEGSRRMRSQVVLIAKNLIRSRAALNADILLLDDFDKIWVHDKPETVTNALRSQ